MSVITIEDLTTGALDGTGSFDKLMDTISIRLKAEFDKNRIKGTDYSTVYLGAMQAVLAQSVQFELSKQTADKQADLLDAQRLQVEQETANAVLQGNILIKQLDKLDAEIELLGQQSLKVIADTALVDAQITKSAAESDLIVAQEGKVLADINVSVKQLDVMDGELTLQTKQGLKLTSETSLTDKQIEVATQTIATAVAQESKITADAALTDAQKIKLQGIDTSLATSQKTKVDKEVLLTDQQISNAVTQNTVLANQATKINAEEDLLVQKKHTESAQILDTVNGTSVTGAIGKQKELQGAQINGYKRDAEQKLSKIMVDTWNVRRTTDSLVEPTFAGISDTDINSVLAIAKAGISS